MPETQRIGIVGPYPPYRGGIAQFTERMHRALDEAGQRVTGVSFRRLYPSLFFPGASQEDAGANPRFEAPRVLDSINPLSWRRTARHLVDAGVERAIFMHWMPFFAPAYASVAERLGRAGVSVSAVVHNALPHERQPLARTLSRRFLQHCDYIVALSETVRRDLVSMGLHDKIDVRPHPTYDQFGGRTDRRAARQALGLPPQGRVLLFFGLVRRYKGVDILLEAMAHMHTEVLLVVAGEWYEDRAEAEALIEQHGLAERVRLVDRYIPDADVATYFSAADAVVQPYRQATQSGVVQTAFHFGVPVVVSGVGGLPEMVGHEVEGLIVAPEDPAALAAALDRLEEPGLLPRLAEGALAARERYTWEHFIHPFLSR
ncbi:MAG: glycosyltransferase [Bacteroidetes bacterium]|nr:glycosyltransferase [Bacteroidota bacterium]MDA0874313.1 glycosyltransferase [Bacteroidota bacterium]